MLVQVTIITQPIVVMITRIDYGSCSHIVKKKPLHFENRTKQTNKI